MAADGFTVLIYVTSQDKDLFLCYNENKNHADCRCFYEVNMRLISWNVNGIRAASKNGWPESLASYGADMICLQETKISADQLSPELTGIPGYKSYFSCADRKGYSGTALFTRREPDAISFGLGDDRFDHEGRTIEADYGDFILYNIYFPNGGMGPERLAFKLDFYDCFLKKVTGQMQAGRKVIVCGDVNTAHREIDLANPAENADKSGFLPEERAWVDAFTGSGLVDSFRMLHPDQAEAYTWWSYRTFARRRNAGWRIDYFFISESLQSHVSESGILGGITGSDHCPIFLDLA